QQVQRLSEGEIFRSPNSHIQPECTRNDLVAVALNRSNAVLGGKNMKRSIFAIAAFASTALLASGPAWAHAKLVSSTPAANATLKAAPRTLTLKFNERLVPAFSKVELLMPAHNNMKVPV